MGMLSRRDLRDAVNCLARIGDGPADLRSIARRGAAALPQLVSSDLTTLSFCNLATGHRTVICNPDEALSAPDVACFDRFFREHPLVCFHATHPRGGSHRISDSLTAREFRETGLYHEYYRKLGFDHAVAMPLYVDRTSLVSFVLNRSRRDFSVRDKDVLDLIRGPVANLFRYAAAADRVRLAPDCLMPDCLMPDGLAPHGMLPASTMLSPREAEVLHWVAAGKSNAEVAEILAISRRTVDKHLERIYIKLGVENRTAAAMRAAGPVRRAPSQTPTGS